MVSIDQFQKRKTNHKVNQTILTTPAASFNREMNQSNGINCPSSRRLTSIKNVESIEAVLGVASSENIYRLANKIHGLGTKLLGRNLSMNPSA
jgi:hypothetical protein